MNRYEKLIDAQSAFYQCLEAFKDAKITDKDAAERHRSDDAFGIYDSAKRILDVLEEDFADLRADVSVIDKIADMFNDTELPILDEAFLREHDDTFITVLVMRITMLHTPRPYVQQGSHSDAFAAFANRSIAIMEAVENLRHERFMEELRQEILRP